jgi:filamentous hemagglutinin
MILDWQYVGLGIAQSSIIIDSKIKAIENVSTASIGQTAKPRTLSEKIVMESVKSNPKQGQNLYEMNSDPRFNVHYGFQKMQYVETLSNGKKITVHYQYNSISGKAYDIKIVTPEP